MTQTFPLASPPLAPLDRGPNQGLWIGVVDEPPAPDALWETLVLSFSPSLVPLRQRWRNNGLSADFLADYVSTFFPATADDPVTAARQADARAAVSYIANELLENAMKYSPPEARRPITLRLSLEPSRIILRATNPIAPEALAPLKALVGRLSETDPLEAYLAAVEGASPTASAGLGLVTMRHDYGARLGWLFEDTAEGNVDVTTVVQVDV